MTPFLKQIADAFVASRSESLIDYCFVFPNKRCSAFFTEYLTQSMPAMSVMPAMTDIESLVLDITHSVTASRIEQLFMLYDCYRTIARDSGSDDNLYFDSFLTWGESVLSDFNDVDRYLVNASELFCNIERFKEISANYLTEEQVNIINRYWHDPIKFNAESRMWNHIDKETTPGFTGFMRLWNVLYKLYRLFRERLIGRGLCYSGMAYRRAVEMLKSGEARLTCKRYVFVGFNVLSTSEEQIFTWFKNNGKGDFYWDYDSPAFTGKNSPAAEFVGKYVKIFPSDKSIGYDFASHAPSDFPEISVIGVPSALGQVKEAGRLLAELIGENPEEFKGDKARRTALVLPDENLLVPLLYSLPQSAGRPNITMGYPMKNTPVASLIKNLIKLQDRTRTVKGEPAYYFEDLKSLLAHPVLLASFPTECEEIVRRINRFHIFNFNRRVLVDDYPSLADFFIIFDEMDLEQSMRNIEKMLNRLKELTAGRDDKLEHAFVLNYIKSFERIRELSLNYDIILSRSSIFQLLQRMATGEVVHFAGEPLKGIQVMGLLETRALDFENLFILSMNEKVFPRKIHSRSFIPGEMRSAYGMSTIDNQEAIFAYYFYRLLTRCKRVKLIYDARSGGAVGEMSRYLYQLLNIHSPAGISHEVKSYAIGAQTERMISFAKTPDMIEKINRFKTRGSGAWLSPSAINRYIECPLGFYLQYVENYRPDDDLKNYIDEGTYGTILHDVARRLYNRFTENGKIKVTPALINDIIGRFSDVIEHEVVASILTQYYKHDKSSLPTSGLRLSSLPGDSEVLAEIMKNFVIKMLRREAESDEFGNFEYLGGEEDFHEHLVISDRLAINLKGSIDRIDRISPEWSDSPVIRIVDYKTGSDDVAVPSIGSLFDINDSKRSKVLLQLMLYCNAYSAKHGHEGVIVPFVYRLKTLSTDPFEYMTIKGEPIHDYRTHLYSDETHDSIGLNELFLSELDRVLYPLFDPETPISQTKNADKACKYCKFFGICDKKIKQF